MRGGIDQGGRVPRLALPLLVLGLVAPALYNGFPLIFPDSGTYLSIAFGQEYAIDRSSIYGFFLKPIVMLVPGVAGLWGALVFQCLLLAALLMGVVRVIFAPSRPSPTTLAAILLATLLGTSLAWHAAQFMPDAFTGATVLLAWLAARRDPGAPGSPLLWLGSGLATLMHYTHVPLLLATVAATLVAEKALGLPWRSVGKRAATASFTALSAILVQVSLNSLVGNPPQMAPMGPLFVFARLHEDGLINPWLAGHCGRDAPPRLCAIAPSLPRDSQILLWGGASTPITGLVWNTRSSAERWSWVADFDRANRGAIADQPLSFLRNSAAGGADQFVHFAPLDDLCPKSCHDLVGGVGQALQHYRRETLPALNASRQVRDTMPHALLDAVIIPFTTAGLLALPLLLLAAWRRRDRESFGLVAGVGIALLANAALAGALSDVHDRYQSRIAWLAPFVALLLLARWRRERSLARDTNARQASSSIGDPNHG